MCVYYERLMPKEKVLIDCEKGTPKLVCPKCVYAKNNLYPNIYIYIYIYIYIIFLMIKDLNNYFEGFFGVIPKILF